MDAKESSRSDEAAGGRHRAPEDSVERYVVVYAAANLAEAYHVKSILAEDGISAEVTNSLLEGGSGVDIVGWPTLPRLLVRQCDADRARQIALDYDRTNRRHRGEIEAEFTLPEIGTIGAPESPALPPLLASPALPTFLTSADQPASPTAPTSPESPGTASHDSHGEKTIATAAKAVAASTGGKRGGAGNELPAWPCCPECGRKRITQCPYCGACGSDFPLGDPPPHPTALESAEVDRPTGQSDRHGQGGPCDSEGRAEQCDPQAAVDIFAPAQRATGPCCGPGGCSPSGRHSDGAEPLPDFPTDAPDEAGDMLVICPQCDEPFVPQFTRQCEWCNRQFTDGHPAATFAGELLNPAAVWLIFGLIGLLGALFAWFAWLL